MKPIKNFQIGNAHIFETQLICGVRHFLQRIVPIALIGVVVKRSAQILQFD